MAYSQHEPNATFRANERNWTLHESRIFPQTRERVWEAITDSDQVAAWMPFRPDRSMDSVGPMQISPTDGMSEATDSEVRDLIPGESLSFTWSDDTVKLDVLEPESGEGTLFGLAHTFHDRNMGSSFAAGWHICLNGLEMLLNGEEVPSMDAMKFGYEELNAAYAQQLDQQVGGNSTKP